MLINQTKTINLIVFRIAANRFCALLSEHDFAALSIKDKKKLSDISICNFKKSLSAEDFLHKIKQTSVKKLHFHKVKTD